MCNFHRTLHESGETLLSSWKWNIFWNEQF